MKELLLIAALFIVTENICPHFFVSMVSPCYEQVQRFETKAELERHLLYACKEEMIPNCPKVYEAKELNPTFVIKRKTVERKITEDVEIDRRIDW